MYPRQLIWSAPLSASASPEPPLAADEAADSIDCLIIEPFGRVERSAGTALSDADMHAESVDRQHERDAEDPPAQDVAIDRLTAARTAAVRGDDPWAEAGRKVLGVLLARMLARVPGVIAGEDPEDVRAMRVAARRMRAAWRVFGDGFEREAMRPYVHDLREVGRRLGAVRDLDVVLEILSAYAVRRSEDGRADLAPLLRSWVAVREARRAELLEVLRSDSFARFVAEYERFVETEGFAALPVARHAPGLIRTRMPATTWAAYQNVWAFDDGIATADPATLHELRIAQRWLRYTLEFVREALEPEATPLIRQVVALQDLLGVQHDFHVAATLARHLVSGSRSLSGRETKAIDRFARHLDRGVERSRRALGPTWRPLVAPAYRRRLGRALARL